MNHLLLSRLTPFAIDLPAATPVSLNLAVDGARDWTYLLKNTGANPLTAGSMQYGPVDDTDLSDPEAFAGGIPLAAGATLPIVGTARPLAVLRLTLTSMLGTTVRVSGGGR